MRIIAGKHKGRKIDCPEGKVIRPTSDMMRSAVFNILNNIVVWEDSNVLDVCCGTGAFGIEALSRGAKHSTFIDSGREAIEATRHNLAKIHEEPNADIVLSSVENLPEARRKYEIIYIDPPYSAGLVPKTLKNLVKKNWIAEGAIIMAEIAERDKFVAPEGFEVKDERRYGNSKLVTLKML